MINLSIILQGFVILFLIFRITKLEKQFDKLIELNFARDFGILKLIEKNRNISKKDIERLRKELKNEETSINN